MNRRRAVSKTEREARAEIIYREATAKVEKDQDPAPPIILALQDRDARTDLELQAILWRISRNVPPPHIAM